MPPAALPSADGSPDDTIYGYANGVSYVTVRASLFDDDFSDGFLQTKNQTKRSDNEKIFDNAVQIVRGIIGGDNDCARFFKNKEVALAALNGFASNAVIGTVDDPNVGIEQRSNKKHPGTTGYISQVSEASYLIYGIITINKSGNFFNKFSKAPEFGGYRNGGTRSQLLQILHELAHVILDKDKNPLIPADADPKKSKEKNVEQSEKNTNTVKTACHKEIEAAVKE